MVGFLGHPWPWLTHQQPDRPCATSVLCLSLCIALLSIPAPPAGISVCGGLSVLCGRSWLGLFGVLPGRGSPGISRAMMMLVVGNGGGVHHHYLVVMHEKVGSIGLGRWKKTHSSAAWSISVH